MTLSARLRRMRRSDEGFSLVELLTVMLLFSLVMGVVFPAVILVQRKVNDLEDTASSVGEVRLALQTIDRQARSGNVLYSPAAEATTGCLGDTATNAGTCMRIYTQANGLQRCVQWQVRPVGDGTAELRSRSWSEDWTTTGNVSGWNVISRGLEVPSATSPATMPFRLQGADTVYDSRLLDVRLAAIDERRGEPTLIQGSLSGRNTNYGYDPGVCSPVPSA
jgi:prepilin-type N-terminal cleavage/methylation domain-containing protein